MSGWMAVAAAIVLAGVTMWLALETRRLVKQTTIMEALSKLADTQNLEVREWARGELFKRLREQGVKTPGKW